MVEGCENGGKKDVWKGLLLPLIEKMRERCRGMDSVTLKAMKFVVEI